MMRAVAVDRGERGVEPRAIDVADFEEEAVVERIDVIRPRDERTQVESAIGERRERIAQRAGPILDFDRDAAERAVRLRRARRADRSA